MQILAYKLIKALIIAALGLTGLQTYKLTKNSKKEDRNSGRTSSSLDVTGPTDTKMSVPTPLTPPVIPVKTSK